MSFSLRSVDVNEMWGPADTIERLQYNGKDLDFGYKWICKERIDYLKVDWIVDQLNKKKITLKSLNKALKSLERSWLCVKNKHQIKKEEERLIGEINPYEIDSIKRNIEVIKHNQIFEKKAKKYEDLKNKIPPFTLSLLVGDLKNFNKQKITKRTIEIYNKIRKYYCWKEPRLDDFIIVKSL